MVVELTPQTKIEEERPLLKVEEGSGDGSGRQPPAASPAWSVTCSTKRSWFDRWPEFLTACWMTGILLAISFLVMYVLTIGLRKQPVLIINCNTSKHNNEVYYHHVVTRWKPESFQLYSDYLADLAERYPKLNFNVIFMIDDSKGLRHNKLYGRLIPISRDILDMFENHNNVHAIRYFQQRYPNVNITITHLSKFMCLTPLRYKWRSIPPLVLPFYARVFSVWQTGGIAIDLVAEAGKFNSRVEEDKRIATLLRQHNDGINPDDYKQALDFIQRNEDLEYITEIFKMVNQVFSQLFQGTSSLFNSSFWFPPLTNDKEPKANDTLVRTHRNKREATDHTTNKNNESFINNTDIKKSSTGNTIAVTTEKQRKSSVLNVPIVTKTVKYVNSYFVKPVPAVIEKKQNKTTIQDKKENATISTVQPVKIDEFDYEDPNTIMTYYISLRSDDPDMMFIAPQSLEYVENLHKSAKQFDRPVKHNKPLKNLPYFLTLDTYGLFLASTVPMHPFLGHIMSADSKRLPPSYVINNVYVKQCHMPFKADVYCKNIYLI